jgi:uncharacterized protein (TIGR02217 family)
MAITDILTLTPEFGFEESIEFKTLIDESETGHEVRDALVDTGMRQFKLNLKFRNEDSIQSLWDFYMDRQGKTDDFLIKVITDFYVTDEPIGVGDGTTTQFLLHNFPVDTSTNNSAKLNGVANLAYILSNDIANEKSYITFTTAPALGDIITASYEFYIRVRFKEDQLSRQLVSYKLLNVGLDLVEVRWNTYFPVSGNSSSSSSSSSANNISTRWYAPFWLNSASTTYNGTSFLNQSQLMRVSYAHCVTKMTISRMIVYLDTAPGSNKKRTFTLYINELPTTLTCTIAGSVKTAEVSSFIVCNDGDYVQLREDQYNSPTASRINLGFSVITNDPRRQPIPGPIHGYLKSSILPCETQDTVFSQNYAGISNALGVHSLMPAPGYLRNLQSITNRITGVGVQTGSLGEAITEIKRYTVADRFVSTGYKTIIPGLSYQIGNTDAFRVEEGDILIYDNNWDVGESTNFNATYPQSSAIDFVPDTAKQGIYACQKWGSIDTSPSQNLFNAINGRCLGFETTEKMFTYFAVPGRISKMILWMYNTLPVSGFPLVFTVRKNQVDTNVVFNITNIVQKITLEPCLRIAALDRLSIKLSPVTLAPSQNGSSSAFYLSWVFTSDNGGEWPIFGQLSS